MEKGFVRIDCYRHKDEPEISYCVETDHEEIAARMKAALDNGMLPVLRMIGRKAAPVEESVEAPVEAAAEDDQAEEEAHVVAGRRLQEIAAQVRENLKDVPGMWLPLTPGTVPLCVEWKDKMVEFRAAGLGDDVIVAQDRFLDALYGEE